MSWFRVDDTLHAHRKLTKAGAEAMGLWVACGSFAASAASRQDGSLDADEVQGRALLLGIRDWKRAAGRLVSSGLWDVDGDVYRFHDWAHYESAEGVIDAKREKDAKKQKAYRDRKATAGNAVGNEPVTRYGNVTGNETVTPGNALAGVTRTRDAYTCTLPVPPHPVPPHPGSQSPGDVSAARREIPTPPLDPHTQARMAYTLGVEQALARPWSGIIGFPEEDQTISALLTDATKAHTEELGAFDLPRFLDKLTENVRAWVTEERAAGREKFSRGWRPTKFVEWFYAAPVAAAPAPQESRWGPPTDAELGLAPKEPATGLVGAPDLRVDA